MKLSQRQIVLGSLMLVVIASGCTGGDTEVEYTQTQGVQVQEFTTFQNTVYGGGEVQLTTVLKNTGGADASGVSMEIFNLPSSWGVPGTMNFGTLQSPDPEDGIPSVSQEETVTLTAPNPNNEAVLPFSINGRLVYNYETIGTTMMELISRDRFREQERSISQPTMENTGGPIQLSVRTRTPIIVHNSGDTASQFCVVATNEGNGVPYRGSDATTNTNELYLNPSVQSGDINLGGEQTVNMENGRGVACWSIGGVSNTDIQMQVPVSVEAEYNYKQEVSTGVTVHGE